MSLTETQNRPDRHEAQGEDRSRFLGVPRTFLSFLAVGGMAFVVTEVMLYLAYDSPLLWFLPDKDSAFGVAGIEHPDGRLLVASALAVEIAILFKFLAYEYWTFRHRRRPATLPMRLLQLNAASLLGAAVTVTVVNLVTPVLGLSPYLSTPLGVLAAFMLNWVASSNVIWPEHEQEAARPPLDAAG